MVRGMLAKQKLSPSKKLSPTKKPTSSDRLVKGPSKLLPIMSRCDRGGVDRSKGSNSKRKARDTPSDSDSDSESEDQTLANIRLKMCRMNADGTDGDKTDGDDDFVDDVPPTVKLGKASSSENKGKNILDKGNAKMVEVKPRKRRTSKTVGIPCIIHRTKLELFLDYLKGMNEVQRRTVIDLGFGKLFDISLTRIPRFLCRWLVENYNPRNAKIFFPDGNHIDVTYRDVEICLGFPRGPVEVEKISRLQKFDVVDEWRQQIGRNLHSVTIQDVGRHMLSFTHGGEFFIRNFIILLHSCVIEPSQSGAANQTLIRSLESVENVGRMNWCGFVISCLVKAKEKWAGNPVAKFTGCLFFLTVLYLDRVILYSKRSIPRQFPAFIGWTDKLVDAREKMELKVGVFSDGIIEPQMDINDRQPINIPVQDQEPQSNTNQEFKRSLAKDLKDLADVIQRIADKSQHIPSECKDDEVCNGLVESARLLLGSKPESLHDNPLKACTQVGKTISQSQDPIWTDPELISMVEEIEAAMNRRSEIIRNWDDDFNYNENLPFFSPSPRQTEQDQQNKVQVDAASDLEHRDNAQVELQDDPPQGVIVTTNIVAAVHSEVGGLPDGEDVGGVGSSVIRAATKKRGATSKPVKNLVPVRRSSRIADR